MVASAKDVWVIESPKVLAVGETRAYSVDFVNFGTPTAIVSTVAFDAEAVDKSSTVLSGSSVIAGTAVTLKLFTPASEQVYRLIVAVTIGGQTKYGVVEVACFAAAHVPGSVAATYYGTPDGVAMLAPRFANRGGKFDDTTRPNHASVLSLLSQVGSILNAILAQSGFTVPVTDADVTPALALFVNQETAAIVEGINGSGRFGPTVESRKGGTKSRFQLITEDVANFASTYAIGLERMGATRTNTFASGIGYRETDESGDTVPPLFQREQFGESYKDWDA